MFNLLCGEMITFFSKLLAQIRDTPDFIVKSLILLAYFQEARAHAEKSAKHT